MSKRRTKLQKLRAQLHKSSFDSTLRQAQSTAQDSASLRSKPEIPLSRASFYTPSLQLPMELLKKDLTKTLIITILAVIVQITLAYYLNHGGWELVNSIVISKLLDFG